MGEWIWQSEEIEQRVIVGLRELGERDALSALKECMIADPKSIRNVSAYLVGIIRRLQRGPGPSGGPPPDIYPQEMDPRHRGRDQYDYEPNFPSKRLRESPTYDDYHPSSLQHGTPGYDRVGMSSPERSYGLSLEEEHRNLDVINSELARMVHLGRLQPDDIPPQLRQFLARVPQRIALQAIADLCAKDLSKIKNIIAYTKGIVRKITERDPETAGHSY